MTVGENLRRIRKERGLTQKELGELCGIKEANIRKYELGKANPKIETISRIAKALGVHLWDLANTSIWEEFDRTFDTEELAKEVTEIGAIQSYLEELGYIVKLSSIPISSHEEEVIDSNGKVIGVSTVVDEEIPQWNVSGNGLSVTLLEADFIRLKSSSADLINSFLWQKSRESK